MYIRLPWNVLRKSREGSLHSLDTSVPSREILSRFGPDLFANEMYRYGCELFHFRSRRRQGSAQCSIRGSQCVGQSGAGHLARSSVNVLRFYKSLCGLSQNNFAKFLALTRMILRSSRFFHRDSFIFTHDIFIEIRGASVFIYRDIRSNIALHIPMFIAWLRV